MKGITQFLAAVLVLAGTGSVSAAEVAGAPADVPAEQATAEPSNEQVRQTVQDYIKQITEDEGDFAIEDEVTGNLRTLTLDRVQEQVGKTGGAYVTCAEMKDLDTNEALDVDFDVESLDGELDVVDVRIHKVNGTPRYTYDAEHNIVPATESQPGA